MLKGPKSAMPLFLYCRCNSLAIILCFIRTCYLELMEIRVKLLNMIKHIFRSATTRSKAIRFCFTMQYQKVLCHRKWWRLMVSLFPAKRERNFVPSSLELCTNLFKSSLMSMLVYWSLFDWLLHFKKCNLHKYCNIKLCLLIDLTFHWWLHFRWICSDVALANIWWPFDWSHRRTS